MPKVQKRLTLTVNLSPDEYLAQCTPAERTRLKLLLIDWNVTPRERREFILNDKF